MVLKRGDLFIIFGIVLGLIIIYYSALLFMFSVGDYISDKSGSQIGRVQGISPLRMGYLIIWDSGDYTVEPFWNIKSLSSAADSQQIDKITTLRKQNNSAFSEFKKEDTFNNYIISENESVTSNVLMYFGLFGNPSDSVNFSAEKECSPDFSCSGWGECYADYTLQSLFSNSSLKGVSYRYCKDSNKCFPDLIDSKECFNGINITTRINNWCNQDYLEVLDSYDRVLARLDSNNFNNSLNVRLNMGNTGYCKYCHDGKKDFDETGKDCGGSCLSCAEVKKLTSA